MHKPEFILENGTHKILWDFEIQTNHSILARRPDLVLINQNLSSGEFWCSDGPLGENKRKWKD